MKVLIVRIGAMGDVLHALASAAALRGARPDWRIDWVVDERWRSLLGSDVRGPVVDLALPLPIREWKRFPRSGALLHSVRELYGLRQDRYDVVVDMQGTLRSGIAGWLAGGQRLVGYADPREAPARHLYGRRGQRRGVHVVEQGAALLGEAGGLALAPAYAELPVDEMAERWADTLLAGLAGSGEPTQPGEPAQRLAVLAPSAGWPAKQWPTARFGLLARRLAAEGWTVLVNHPGGNDPIAARTLTEAAGAAQGVSCSIAEFTSLLRRARLLVGGDSGPTHLAATLGTPLVALFGPTDPERNGPWGRGPRQILRHPTSITSYRHVARADPGLAQVSVEEVLSAVRRL